MKIKRLLEGTRRRWKLVVFIVLLLAGVGFWYYKSTVNAQPHYTFIKPSNEDLVKTLDISGVVDAKEKARLRFASGGKIVYLGAQQGDLVKKGQTIATIDRATLQKQMEQDLNDYKTERLDFEQEKDDTRDDILDTELQREREQSQLSLNNQVLNVEIQNIGIRNTVLSAPFAGVLTVSPTAVTGVQLIATDYFEVINPDTLVFIGRVDEADIAQVNEGQITNIALDAYPDTELTTYVDQIAFTSSQTASGTAFDIQFPLSQLAEKSLLRLGMNGDAKIVLDDRKNVMTIPITATRQRDEKIYVDVRTGEKTVKEREITVGLETEDKYEVLGGLSVNDEVVQPE
jgi:RND family efflux transporter MFP subunit